MQRAALIRQKIVIVEVAMEHNMWEKVKYAKQGFNILQFCFFNLLLIALSDIVTTASLAKLSYILTIQIRNAPKDYKSNLKFDLFFPL